MKEKSAYLQTREMNELQILQEINAEALVRRMACGSPEFPLVS
jgi:hypothetical protein